MLLTEKVNNFVDKSVDIVDKLKKSDGKLYFSPDFLFSELLCQLIDLYINDGKGGYE